MSNHTRIASEPVSNTPLAAPGIPAWLCKLPGNEALTISVQEKEIAIPRLAQTNEELRLVHISDLHMSGRITRAYFEWVIDEVNSLKPDLVAITGDIVERERCLSWIPDTLGRLQAAHGVYYVLGNHDLNVDETRLKCALDDAGLVYVGGIWRELNVRGIPVVLAGNELPWYTPAADLSNCPDHNSLGVPLRILLAHSPDQFPWALSHGIDLMLAGHLHGGQVQFPVIGAIFSPSRFGVRYIAGAYVAGNTVLHVSRGTGSLTPLRYNCPPEIALLKLQASRSV